MNLKRPRNAFSEPEPAADCINAIVNQPPHEDTLTSSKQDKRNRLAAHGRYIKGAALGTLGFCTSSAVDRTGAGREWLDIRTIDLPLDRIPAGIKGKRIIQVSDLHLGRTVSPRYLENCIDRVNTLEGDIVVLTGDYITHDRTGAFRRQVAGILKRIRSNYGAYACLGNHDYGMLHSAAEGRQGVLESMLQAMTEGGVHVLRNQSAPVLIEGHVLWLVGLGDLWVGDFHPQQALAEVPSKEDTVVLAHNPRAIDRLHGWPVGIVMSGHTHGAQAIWTFKNGLRRKIRNFHAGMYEVAGRKLYVNRGLGRLGRARLNARPEITVLTIR